MIDGTVKSKMALLHPTTFAMNPNINELAMEDNALIDPIFESCSFVNGPLFNGVSFDRSSGADVAKLPIIVPKLM